MIDSEIEVCRGRVVLPVANTVSNYYAFKIDLVRVSDNLPSEVWNVDTRITLASEVEVVFIVLREFLVPVLKECVFLKTCIEISDLLAIVAHIIAYSCRVFDIEHIGLEIPRELVIVRLGMLVNCVEDAWSVLKEGVEHDRAGRAAGKPYQERVAGGVILRLHKIVVEHI